MTNNYYITRTIDVVSVNFNDNKKTWSIGKMLQYLTVTYNKESDSNTVKYLFGGK